MVRIAGETWQDDAGGVLLPTWQRPLGYVFQEASLFEHLDVRGNLRSNNAEALIIAAVGGQGITCQPEFLVAREIAAGQLTRIELDQPAALVDGIFALYPAARPPAKVRAFIDFFVARFRRRSSDNRPR